MTQGIDLCADKYEIFYSQNNLAKAKAVNPKYRSVLNILDEKIYFTPGLSVEESDTVEKMQYLFFAKNTEVKAPIENKHGSSAAISTSQIQRTISIMKRYLTITFLSEAIAMPDYVSMFAFTNVEGVKRLVDYVTEQSDDLHNEVSSITIPQNSPDT